MDAPAPVHLKEMYKVIRHVLSTKGYGLKFELRKDMIKWALKALSDSDFASDKETRISVFGYIIYFCGIPISWRSKGMKSVVLSTTEAEYMELSEVVKELCVLMYYNILLLLNINIPCLSDQFFQTTIPSTLIGKLFMVIVGQLTV